MLSPHASWYVGEGNAEKAKPEQGEAIIPFLIWRDVFVVLLTGYGRATAVSRSFLSSIEEQSIVVVVSPLS